MTGTKPGPCFQSRLGRQGREPVCPGAGRERRGGGHQPLPFHKLALAAGACPGRRIWRDVPLRAAHRRPVVSLLARPQCPSHLRCLRRRGRVPPRGSFGRTRTDPQHHRHDWRHGHLPPARCARLRLPPAPLAGETDAWRQGWRDQVLSTSTAISAPSPTCWTPCANRAAASPSARQTPSPPPTPAGPAPSKSAPRSSRRREVVSFRTGCSANSFDSRMRPRKGTM